MVLAPNRRSIGTYPAMSLAEARERAKGLLRDYQDGKDPFRSPSYGIDTFGDLAQSYMKEYAARNHQPAWIAFQEDILRRFLLPALGHRKLNTIKRADLISVLQDVGGRGIAIGNRTRAILMAIFNWGIEWDKIEATPATRLPKVGKERPRQRVLSRTELARLFDACDEIGSSTADVIKLRFLTMQREESIRAMRSDQIDGERWIIPRQKNEDSHLVFLSPQARAVIEPRFGGEWVFPKRRGDGYLGKDSQGVRRLKAKAGISPWQPRDLRRTATTLLTEAGENPFIVDKALGHRDRRSETATVYDRYGYANQIRDALFKLGEIYDDIRSSG